MIGWHGNTPIMVYTRFVQATILHKLDLAQLSQALMAPRKYEAWFGKEMLFQSAKTLFEEHVLRFYQHITTF